MESLISNLFYFNDISFIFSNSIFESHIYVFFSKTFSFFVEYTLFDENYYFNNDIFIPSNNNINENFLITRWEKCFDLKGFVNLKNVYEVIFNKA